MLLLKLGRGLYLINLCPSNDFDIIRKVRSIYLYKRPDVCPAYNDDKSLASNSAGHLIINRRFCGSVSKEAVLLWPLVIYYSWGLYVR
jgi:hypothetical protein